MENKLRGALVQAETPKTPETTTAKKPEDNPPSVTPQTRKKIADLLRSA